MTEWHEVNEPKIWVSRFMSDLELVSFGSQTDGSLINFINAFSMDWDLAKPEDVPKNLYFSRHKKIPKRRTDAFLIVDWVMVISSALHNVLTQFDLGQAQLFEVPIYADENGTPSGLPNHYVLNVHAHKDTFISEYSENVKLPIAPMRTEPSPDAKYSPKYSLDVLAVKASSEAGPDLWHDPEFRRRFFLSDRLKRAIDAANLQVGALDLYPARVFERV